MYGVTGMCVSHGKGETARKLQSSYMSPCCDGVEEKSHLIFALESDGVSDTYLLPARENQTEK